MSDLSQPLGIRDDDNPAAAARRSSVRSQHSRRSFGRVELVLSDSACPLEAQAQVNSRLRRSLGIPGFAHEERPATHRSSGFEVPAAPAWSPAETAAWLGFQYPPLRGHERLLVEGTSHAGGMHFGSATTQLQVDVCLTASPSLDLVDTVASGPHSLSMVVLWGRRFWHAPFVQQGAPAQMLQAISNHMTELIERGMWLSPKPMARSVLEVSLRVAGFVRVGEEVVIEAASPSFARWCFGAHDALHQSNFGPEPDLPADAAYLMGYTPAHEERNVDHWTQLAAVRERQATPKAGHVLVGAHIDGEQRLLEVPQHMVRDANRSVL